MSTSGAPLAAGLLDAEDMGSADAGTAGVGIAQCIALRGFSFLPWERMAGIRYNGVEVAVQEDLCFAADERSMPLFWHSLQQARVESHHL